MKAIGKGKKKRKKRKKGKNEERHVGSKVATISGESGKDGSPEPIDLSLLHLDRRHDPKP